MTVRPDSPWTIRAADADDFGFLACMLGHAVAWRPDAPALDVEIVIKTPGLADYIDGWPRADDHGLIAVAATPVGAAWWRQFPADASGYGYVADDVPEVAIAVRAEWRGRGIGTALLEALIAAAASRGLRALSLSVDRDNPASRLYKRLGFVSVGGVGNAITMLREP